jgi:hypothetical protein
LRGSSTAAIEIPGDGPGRRVETGRKYRRGRNRDDPRLPDETTPCRAP